MTTTLILQFFVLLPLVGFLACLLVPGKKEKLLSQVTFVTVGIHLLAALVFAVWWFVMDRPTLNMKDLVIFSSSDYQFYLDFCFDKITLVYLLVGAFLTFMVTVYSSTYLHREKGYKRFFNTVLFFYIGYNITIFAGNFETLFVGWEILGISSFLLIAFYNDRLLPVKNSVKVFSIYRISDIGLILAMWASHHLWHENITFLKLNDQVLVHEHLSSDSVMGIFISLMILITAAAKSAQLPFSSWLPRAMEGPTPSSAIFYGSLSVHVGVFLLLRTFPFWENQLSVRILIAVLGLSTAVVATLIARVQSSVKSQIAYASIAQIGLIFIEIAAGFENLALFHFAGNAFLRTYQLLVSPSVVTYLIREQFYNFVPRRKTLEDSFPKKLEYSIYMLSLKEWNLDYLINKYVWKPLKWTGKILSWINVKKLIIVFIPVYALGIIFLFRDELIPKELHAYLPAMFSLLGLFMIIRAFAERQNVRLAWVLVVLNHFCTALAINYNEHFSATETMLYLSGITGAGLMGYFCLSRLRFTEPWLGLDKYYGHVYEHPRLAFVFFLCCLGLTGFPITPTFIGEDLIFSHIHENQYALALFTSLSFITDGIVIIRIYARVFLGPHIKTYHATPFKTS